MARETRRIGIRTAQVRLPTSTSFGPALVKTAGSFAQAEFAKLSDKRTQEAIRDAGALNFERDSEGFLIAPTVPIGDNGLLAPSIYDREYTNMVGQRYLQQMKIDISETINKIAAENPNEPEIYRTLVEGYVAKVTELAPDYLKPDVNNSAQIKMVEHYNHIIRVRAEEDRDEAKGMQLREIDTILEDLDGYVAGGAPLDVQAGVLVKARAAIEQGNALRFWQDDEAAEMHEQVDRRYVAMQITRMINEIPRGDLVAASELVIAFDDFANNADGTFPMIDAAGTPIDTHVSDLPFNQAERIAMATFATQLLTSRMGVFEDNLDARVDRDWDTFYQKYSRMAMESIRPGGDPIDLDWMYNEFNKADNNVIANGYDDKLREEIRRLIDNEYRSSGTMSQWRKDFLASFGPWERRYKIEFEQRLAGRDPKTMTKQELLEVDHGARMAVGNVAGGNRQTADGAREIIDFYGAMTGRDLSQDLFEDMIGDPDHHMWDEMQWQIDSQMSKIGIWQQEASNAIIGKINSPEGMNVESIEGAMRLARMYWDNPTFRNNMRDENALGHMVGGALDHLFRFGGQPTVGNVTKLLENYSDPQYSPRAKWNALDPDDRESFRLAARSAITSMFVSNWKTAWMPRGLQVPGFGFNPFDADLAGVPIEVMDAVEQQLIANAGHIDPDDLDSFGPFISSSIHKVMHEKGYAPSRMGYSQVRHGDQYHFSLTTPLTQWRRPDSAIVQRPPEYYATRDKDGNLDSRLIEIIEENFQTVLDGIGTIVNPTEFNLAGVSDRFIVDVNAALEYDAQASQAFGYPNWNIRLIQKGGGSEILTEDGTHGGDRVLFDILEAEIRRAKEKEAEQIRRNLIEAQLRLDRQSGKNIGVNIRP